MNEIYFDNSATTRVDDGVAAVALKVMTEHYGNPSSLHRKGFEAEQLLKQAQKDVSTTIGAKPEEIFFTSGGTEANNIAVTGVANAMKRRGNRIVTTSIEHSSISAQMDKLEAQGFEIIRLVPNQTGEITAQQIVDAVDENTILVSVMLVNNEVGSIMPLEQAIKKIRRKNKDTKIHCDAVQGFGKIPIKVNRALDVDLLSASGHKIHAPKGIGMLYIKKGTRVTPIINGGGQQKGIRPGTEPLPLICAFAKACVDAHRNMKENWDKVSYIKQYIQEKIKNNSDVCINSPLNSIPYILNISCLGIRSETMLHFLEKEDIFVSSGSACSKGAKSPVLTAMDLSNERIDSALRLSFGKDNTIDEAETFVKILAQGMDKIAKVKLKTEQVVLAV